MLKLPNSIEPAVMAENIVHLRDAESNLEGRVSDLEATAPKDYSTTETATGQKWIDGKEIYSKVITGTLPALESSYNLTLLSDNTIDDVLFCNLTSGGDTVNRISGFSMIHSKTTGDLIIYSIPTAWSESSYYSIILYTKKTPVPGDAKGPEEPEPEEPEEKKTTKKKTTK